VPRRRHGVPAFASRVAGHAGGARRSSKDARGAGETRIVDLCSGGAGPVAEIVDQLAAERST
jgi:hypothetical protein